MSQIFTSSSSSPSPPDVPTTFQTDSGNAVPAANILLLLADDTTDNNANGITTEGSGNTVTILLTNRFQGTGTAVGATTADLVTYDLGGSAAVYRFEFYVTGRDTVSGDGVGYSLMGSARTNGVAATVISTPFYDADEDASLTTAQIELTTSGNNVILRVTGVAGSTINYSAVGTYVKV
jgi:hypothetical protein